MPLQTRPGRASAGRRIRDYGTAQVGDCMPLSSMSQADGHQDFLQYGTDDRFKKILI